MNNSSQNGYDWFNNIKDCYNSLVDDLSKKVFLARIKMDISNNICNQTDLVKYSSIDNVEIYIDMYKKFNEISIKQIPVYLYGAGIRGQHFYELFINSGMNIVSFIDKRYNEFKSYCGIPVISPPRDKNDILKESIIIIATKDYQTEICDYLFSIGIDENRILQVNEKEQMLEHQYFDFPEKYKKGIFIDAGCLNLETSITFVNWCNGDYKKIIAFEPDKKSYEDCLSIANENKLKNVQMVRAGLGKQKGFAYFDATNNASSHISEMGTEKINIVALDDIVKEEKVSFIKMDIEGAEFDALQGAKQTIQRDKPLCAISVYHKSGDIIVIMQYLKQLVPEYQFAVRHYTAYSDETVLYAFI